MTRRSTFKAFSQWQFQIQKKMKYQNLIDRCSARRNQKYKKGCYFKWKRKVRNSIRKRNKTKKVLLRMTRHIVARGWRTWINIHTSEKRKEKIFLANGKKSKLNISFFFLLFLFLFFVFFFFFFSVFFFLIFFFIFFFLLPSSSFLSSFSF